MRETLCSLIDDALRRGTEAAFVQREGLRAIRWSYAKVAQTAFQVARELEARGLGKGDRVLLWGENSAEWVAAFFGCLLRGAVAVPLDEQNTAEFATRVQRQVGAKLLLCGREQRERLGSPLPSIPLDALLETVHRQSTEPYNVLEIQKEDLAEIVFTSGTTAEPKGVCLTHRNLLANLNPLEREIGKYRWLARAFHPVRFLCLLPLSHVFGQFMGIFVPHLLGGKVVFVSSLNPGEIGATIRREGIHVAAVVPRQLETLQDSVERSYAAQGKLEDFRRRFAAASEKHFLRRWWMFRDLHWRFGWRFIAFVSGGATLEEPIEIFWHRLGFGIVQGYGLTETASIISVNHPFKTSRGSIGRSLPGQEIKLDDSGEILVRGENVSVGYWRGEGTAPSQAEGWLRTGDVAARDTEGNLYFKGRQKDVIVTAAGVNVYPEDLESALNHEPEVQASCVLGVEGAGGPEPMAVLILRDEKANVSDIVKRVNAHLSSSQQIRRWSVWPEPDFPRTSTQKIRKAQVRDRVLSGVADQPAALTLTDTDLKKLDSLGRVALLGELEERYQIELDEASLTPESTVHDLEQKIRARFDEGAPAMEYSYPRWALRWPVTWLNRFLYYVLIVPFVAVMCWPRARGRDRLRGLRSPVLFVANHVAMMDSAMVLFALPGRFRRHLTIAMGGERLRGLRYGLEHTTWIGGLLDRVSYVLVILVFNVFAIPQKSGFRRSFAYAGEAADRGFNVLVFPEGKVTRDGKMNPFMSGIGLLAANLNLPVVPIKIEGLFNLARERRYFSRPGTVTVTFGEPVEFPADTDPATITRELEKRVRELNG
jgi:long-chain acyl-CoA synthetase